MQPITKLGTINALRGLKRPQKTVVRLKYAVYMTCMNQNSPSVEKMSILINNTKTVVKT